MLRSLNTGISGLRSSQTALDVAANNIANVNTTGFKGSSVQFQDTLSQLTQTGVAPDQNFGGSNPAQVGLGVQVAAVSTNHTQGASQATGVATHMMLNGDGFFIVNVGGEQAYTRAGAFSFNSTGQLVGPAGELVQGWTANNGQVNTGGPVGNIQLPADAALAPQPTTGITLSGNLPSDAATGTEIARDVEVYDAQGNASVQSLTFTKTDAGWDVSDGTATTSLAFTNGTLPAGTTATLGGIPVSLEGITGYAEVSSLQVTDVDGRGAGTLRDFQVGADGSLVGVYSNGETQLLGQVAVATFENPGALQKAGGSTYVASAASGQPEINAPGENGAAGIASGALEMSNVDLSTEFTNLILAQRGFQASSRVITTSDEILNEVVNLKR